MQILRSLGIWPSSISDPSRMFRLFPEPRKRPYGRKGDFDFGGIAVVDASLVLDAIVAVSIAAGALFTIYQLQIMARDRQTEFIMRVGEFVCAKDFMETICKIWESKSQDAKGLETEVTYAELSRVADYFEGISGLARRRLVKEELVLEAYSLDVLWEKMKPWILELRKDYPYLWTTFENLAKKSAKVPWRQRAERVKGV